MRVFNNPSMKRTATNIRNDVAEGTFKQATYGGIATKSVIYAAATLVPAMLVALLFNSAVGNQNEQILSILLLGMFVSALPMLIMSFIIAFVPSTARVLGIIYSVLQGVFLGFISALADLAYPGVALAAILCTMAVFLIAVVLNKMLEVHVSSKFVRGLLIAFVSLAVAQLVLWIISLFSANYAGLFNAIFWIQFAISLVCVVWATVYIMWNLDQAEALVQGGAPKKYEWNVAFALITTIVWLYLEILELLLRILAIFGRNR